MKYILITAIIILATLFFQCSDSGTNPDDNLKPGRRDYVWSLDTVTIPFNSLNRIGGSAPDDLWSTGQGGWLATTIWHYDGNRWSTDSISRGIAPLAVWSFDSNNVWISGNEGKIWHYNGNTWSENLRFVKTNWNVGFQEIWGDSPINLFAVGYADSANIRKGIILRNTGSGWSEIQIPFFPYDFIRIRRGIKTNDNYYLLGIGENERGVMTTALFELNGNKLGIIYDAEYSLETMPGIQEINGEMFFVIGKKITQYSNNQFTTIFEVNQTNFWNYIIGRNRKDIFLMMKDGLCHYSGNDIQYVYNFPDNWWTRDIIVFEGDIFINTSDFDNGRNIIIHGKLN